MNSFFRKLFSCAAFAACVPAALFAQEKVSAEAAVVRNPVGVDLSAPLADVPAETPSAPAPAAAVPAPKETFPEARRAFIFECEPKDFSEITYAAAVENLIAAYEKNTGRRLVPAEKKKAALKLYTASGRGLATPKALVRAVRAALEKRGFARDAILLVDQSERNLRLAGYLPPFRKKNDFFWEGSPVAALDTERFYNKKWFYENSLPSREAAAGTETDWEDIADERKSFLPVPLLFDVDFWINLPVACDSQALGVSAALGNATLWNASNQKRFLDNPANAVHMAVSIATIPEFRRTFELTILSLEKYQFIGGPVFNENYTLSENRLWLSANPVVLDFLMWRRMNEARSRRGYEQILPEPALFASASRGEYSLGSCVFGDLKLIRVDAR